MGIIRVHTLQKNKLLMHKMLKTVSSTQEVLMERALHASVVVNSNNHDNFLTSKVSYLIHRVGPTEIIAEWCFKYIHCTRSCHLYSAKQRVSEILTQVSEPLSSNRAVTPSPASIDGISRPKVIKVISFNLRFTLSQASWRWPLMFKKGNSTGVLFTPWKI